MICLTTGKPADGMSLVVGRIRHPASSAYMLAINALGELMSQQRKAAASAASASAAAGRADGAEIVPPVGNTGGTYLRSKLNV